jgi:hypothetical protein
LENAVDVAGIQPGELSTFKVVVCLCRFTRRDLTEAEYTLRLKKHKREVDRLKRSGQRARLRKAERKADVVIAERIDQVSYKKHGIGLTIGYAYALYSGF